MKVFFNQLFDYNFYCNKKIIADYKELDDFPEKSVALFSHILNAHHIWNRRLQQKESEYGVFQIQDSKEWDDIHYENQRTSFEIITGTEDFDTRIDYEDTKGRLFTNTIGDMLFHIINHSAHHRGQILMDLRLQDIQPPALDYIHYKR